MASTRRLLPLTLPLRGSLPLPARAARAGLSRERNRVATIDCSSPF